MTGHGVRDLSKVSVEWLRPPNLVGIRSYIR
jgi:hypothetical protein